MALTALASSAGTITVPGAARQLAPEKATEAMIASELTAQAVQEASAATSSTSSKSSTAESTSSSSTSSKSSSSDKSASSTTTLSPEAQAVVARLVQRDQQVRAHEMAHLTTAGDLATSGANYTYEKGPDGQRYAVGGEVGIDVSPGRTPQETIDRARIIQAAALAPADPSGPDRAIAARAAQMAIEAQGQLAQQQAQQRLQQGSGGGGGANAVQRRYFGEPPKQSQVNVYA